MYILSQIFIVISGILFALSYLFEKKGLILIINVFNNLFFAIHFLLLKSFTASYSVFVIAFFLIIIYFLDKYNKKHYKLLSLIIALILVIIISIFTWESALSLLPICATTFNLVGTILNKTLTVKLFYFFGTVLNTIFMFIITSYFGFGINIAILIVGAVGIINHLRFTKKV